MTTGSIQTYSIGLSFSITNTSEYQSLAFISTYEIQNNAGSHEIMAEAQALTVNSNYCFIKLYTNIVLNHFKFTHILYRASTSTFKPIYYGKVYHSDTGSSFVSSIDVPSIFSALGYSKCIIGISYNILISSYSDCGSIMQITESSSLITYILTITNSKTLYSIFC